MLHAKHCVPSGVNPYLETQAVQAPVEVQAEAHWGTPAHAPSTSHLWNAEIKKNADNIRRHFL